MSGLIVCAPPGVVVARDARKGSCIRPRSQADRVTRLPVRRPATILARIELRYTRLMALPSWWADARHRLSQRALQRQADYQKGVAQRLRDHGDQAPSGAEKKPPAVEELLSYAQLPERPRVLEVGTAGRGVLFYLSPTWVRVGVDPLALNYRFLFPPWTRRVQTCAAFGEELPFGEQVFDLVVCDNVIDHAETPASILRELIRVLKPNGLLYFTVNVHHPIYYYASVAHRFWNAVGVPFEIGPFADHTFHFTVEQARRLLAELPLTVLVERHNVDAARQQAKMRTPRHLGDRLKRIFFKNARYVMIAVRPGAATAEQYFARRHVQTGLS
jgi:SAM-dependent methyltransferase